MNRKLSARSRLENLRKDAKRWLKALRTGDAKALERLRSSYPGAPAEPGLRDVQHALAREHGAESWAALKAALADLALAHGDPDELLRAFLEFARLRYGNEPGASGWNHRYYDDPSRWAYAARILDRHPRIAQGNIHAAAVSGDVAEVRRILAARRAAASERAELDGSLPLEYVCYGRLPIPAAAENSVAIAQALLDAGSPVQLPVSEEGADFQPLTAVIGEGENSQPPHPKAEALAALLIERGADPFDPQALYNISLGKDDVFWFDFLYDRSARRGETHKWTKTTTRWPKSPMVSFLLIMAVHRNHPKRAAWALSHGADPRTRHPYYARRSLHTEALLNGYTEMAELLVRAGAVAERLAGQDAFQAACVRLDRAEAARLAAENPRYLQDAAPLLLAASRDLVDVAEFLLDLGVSPNVSNGTNFTPLHAAATHDSVRVGELLIARGAEVDPRETRFDSTPLGWAIFNKKRGMAEILGAVSRNPHPLAWMGNAERLRELFAEEPHLANSTNRNGTLFFSLPDDEDRALEVVELLLASGADPQATGRDGMTAVQNAQALGFDAVADLLRDAMSAPGGHPTIPTT